MKATIKRLVIGTPWEAPLKRLHSRLTGSQNSLYDWQTIEIMRRTLRPDSNGVDVGAFEGGMLRHLLRLAPRGRHFAFEPNAERAAALAARFPNSTILPCALGAAPSEATFHHVLRLPALSGLKRRTDLGAEEAVSEVTVQVDTLDRTIPVDRKIDLVKIDVEGGEFGVFRGGIETLRRNRPVIVFECGLGSADAYGVEPEQVYDIVTEEIGLRLSLLGDWLGGAGTLSRHAFGRQYHERLHFYFVAHP